MATIAAKTNTYCKTNKKESFWSRLMDMSREDRANIICGLLTLNGSTNVYPLYKTLTEK